MTHKKWCSELIKAMNRIYTQSMRLDKLYIHNFIVIGTSCPTPRFETKRSKNEANFYMLRKAVGK